MSGAELQAASAGHSQDSWPTTSITTNHKNLRSFNENPPIVVTVAVVVGVCVMIVCVKCTCFVGAY